MWPIILPLPLKSLGALVHSIRECRDEFDPLCKNVWMEWCSYKHKGWGDQLEHPQWNLRTVKKSLGRQQLFNNEAHMCQLSHALCVVIQTHTKRCPWQLLMLWWAEWEISIKRIHYTVKNLFLLLIGLLLSSLLLKFPFFSFILPWRWHWILMTNHMQLFPR